MIKRLVASFVFMLLCVFAYSQKALDTTEYYYLYGGKNFDEAHAIKELPDGNYIVAGTSSSFGQGNTSAYLIKTDNAGNHLWSFPYGGSQNDWAQSVEVTSDSGYFVAGYSNSFNPVNGYDVWYFKTDKNGNLLWQKTISGTEWDFVYGNYPLNDGFLLCGQTYTNSHGNSDAYLIKINASGDTIWTKCYGGLQDESFNSVTRIGNYYYAVGYNYSTATDSASNGWIVKLDTNGNFVSEKIIYGPHHYGDEVKGILAYDASTFFICGKTDLLDSSSTQSMYAKMDTSLNFLLGTPWSGGLSSAGEYVCFNKVFKLSYDKICFMGTASGGFGGLNVFMVGFDKGLIWQIDFAHDAGMQKDEKGYDGIYTSQGKVVFVGSAQDLCGTNPNVGLEDAFLVRYDTDSIMDKKITQRITQCFADTLFYWEASQKMYAQNVRLRAYPNPTADKFIVDISSDLSEDPEIVIYSVIGERIKTITVLPNSSSEIDVSGIPSGSYILKLQSHAGSTLSLVKLLVAH